MNSKLKSLTEYASQTGAVGFSFASVPPQGSASYNRDKRRVVGRGVTSESTTRSFRVRKASNWPKVVQVKMKWS
jgi:hypothetical protein